ncbi:PREDICTED: uncharacterized protein LOC106113417 [Papilio xuthus]|uniref:Uncharacterized protein LOC106113417 n=1 Tax=Papilio xuthus TaxID=66420 RepID=A0AAJ7E3T8_PAPXU|nr:PREDICTED: uncharacterized protein LOC106113417 [Papilio xuthus]
MEEAPAIADSFEERRKIFKDIWDSSDTNDPEDQKPKVIKTARLSNDVIAIRKKRVKKLKSVCKKVLELSNRKNYIQEEITLIGTRKSKKYKSARVRRRRKTVKKIKSTSSCKSSSKNLSLMNDVTSEGKNNYGETLKNVPVVIENEDVKENMKKFIKPVKVEAKRPKSPVRFHLKQPVQVQRELATLTTINLCM